MYSSPGAPIGTGRNASSSTYTRTLSSGRPIGTTSGTASAPTMLRCVAYVVVSVGP